MRRRSRSRRRAAQLGLSPQLKSLLEILEKLAVAAAGVEGVPASPTQAEGMRLLLEAWSHAVADLMAIKDVHFLRQLWAPIFHNSMRVLENFERNDNLLGQGVDAKVREELLDGLVRMIELFVDYVVCIDQDIFYQIGTAEQLADVQALVRLLVKILTYRASVSFDADDVARICRLTAADYGITPHLSPLFRAMVDMTMEEQVYCLVCVSPLLPAFLSRSARACPLQIGCGRGAS